MLETECLQSALIPCSRERLRLRNHVANASMSGVRRDEMGLDRTSKGRLYLVFSFQASQGNHDALHYLHRGLWYPKQANMLINQILLQQRGTRQPTARTRDSITSLPVPLPSNMARKAPICALRTILRDRNTHSNVALDGSITKDIRRANENAVHEPRTKEPSHLLYILA